MSTFGGLYYIQVKQNHFKRFFCNETSDFWERKQFGCRKILRSSDNRILVVGEAYIMQLQGEKESLVWENKSPRRIGFRGLLSEPDGTLWFADQRIFRRSPSGKIDSWLPGNLGRIHLRSWTILEHEGRLLLDFPLSFFDLEKKEFIPFDQYNGFEDLWMSEIYEVKQDQTGLWWLLTHTGMYTYRPDKGIISRYWSGGTGEYYLPVDNFRSSYEESDGSWWLATGSGLLYWDRNRGTHRLYTTNDGLSNSICHAVLPDSNGFLWISSDFGLMQFEKKTGRVKTYLGIDGLGMDEFNKISFFNDTLTGQFYFGGIDGIVRMDPDDFADQFKGDEGVELVLTEAILFSGETQEEENIKQVFFETGEITIHPGDRFLRLQFALTDYKNTASIQYEYLIEGHDDVWHGGQGNALRLAGLPYGTYSLRVRSKSIAGFGTDREIQIPLNVLKPFYLQWWFLLVVLSVLAGGFLLYVRWRTQALKSQAVKLEAAVKERTQTIESQKEKLDDMRMFQARLYSNVTHEFRTPLTLILGLTNQVKKKLKGGNNPVPESLDHIDQNARHILELVNQLLDINKLEDGKMLPEYRQGNVVEFIQRIMVPYQLLSEAKEIKWSFVCSLDAFEMDFDADKLQKIVGNLWSNAIKFTPPGGWIQVGLQADGSALSIDVSDSGPGIPEDELEFVFDRFYQVDNSLTRMAQGPGIGLALVKELAELMGGTIAVKSALGKGASFTLKLPVSNVAERLDEQFAEPVGMDVPNGVQSISIHDKAGSETGEIQVLLIEDHRGLAEYIRSCLGDRYAVVHIEDGLEALEYATEAVPDIIISDVMLPGMDGFSICERLKNDERTSHIPVIILTALTQHADRVKALQGGADAVLTKPFNEDELLIRIDQLLLLRKKLQAWYQSSNHPNTAETGTPEDVALSREMAFVEKCKSLILSDLENAELDAKSLAHSTGLSASQLHRKLTALTGLAPGRFIYDVRLQAAQQKLEETDLLVSEIAYQCGFNDPAYFSRLFAKKFGHPPSYYRK
ncbi:MAG: ATP-binding protein [Saprospiraceae bacterium]